MFGMHDNDKRVWDAEEGSGSGKAVPTRSDIEEKYKWKLEDIYVSNELWEQDLKEVAEAAKELVALQGHLVESAETLLRAFRLQDDVNERISRLYVYAHMRRDEDSTNATYQALTDRCMAVAVQIESSKAFVVPEILAAPESTLKSYLEQNDELKLYAFVIEELLRQKRHILSAEQEQLLASAGEMAGAPQQIFGMFNNADMVFPTIKDEEGNDVELTHGRYLQFLESRKREVRRNAFKAVYDTYGKHKNTLAAIYGASVKKDVFYAKVRHYDSARQAALDEDNVPLSVYDNLISSVHESLPALHKYFRLRKRILGLDDLHLYDLYTPIVADVDVKVPYDEAVKTVREAISPLGAEYQQIATEGMGSGWIDVFETKGKRSGAYSWGTYGVHPFILLNYQDNLDNMFTLAHELGHAMHSYFSQRSQPFVYHGYTIFVAEVASTCNEALLTHHLLQTTNDDKMKAYLLNHHLETLRGTLFRQTMLAEFEKMTHDHVEQGGALTPEWLSENYHALNVKYYGAECVVDQDIAMEWARIPHFYNAFYVYKYATGISASTALSQKILEEGQPAVEKYLAFLNSGGNDYPIELLRKAGVDMESPEPVRATLQLFSQMVDQLSEVLDKQ